MTGERIDKILDEVFDSFFKDELICEMAMKPGKLSDKYGEVVGAIVDNLVCICLYPDNMAVTHWGERSYGLCKRFVDIDVDPISKNKSEFRYKCLYKAVVEILNTDFSAIKNHFKSVSIYYANRPNPHERLIPQQSVEECYEENKERIKNGILMLTRFVAEQDYESIINYMDSF